MNMTKIEINHVLFENYLKFKNEYKNTPNMLKIGEANKQIYNFSDDDEFIAYLLGLFKGMKELKDIGGSINGKR